MSKIVGFLKDRVKTIHTVGCKSETVMRMFSYYLGQSVKILLNPRFCYVKYIWEVFTGNRHRTGLEFSTHRNHLGGGGACSNTDYWAHPSELLSRNSGRAPGICNANQFPGAADATGPGAAL